MMIVDVAALFVMENGVYAGLEGVDCWGVIRDARMYAGSAPVVAHPPCARWCRLAAMVETQGGARRGDDGGCFASALASVRRCGGVLEHPADSAAWRAHGLLAPARGGGWMPAGDWQGWTCCVEQGHYGHRARKPTWLYAAGVALPALTWGPSGSPLPLDAFGDPEKRRRAVRTGAVQNMSKRQRSTTPLPFRDLLLTIARSAARAEVAA